MRGILDARNGGHLRGGGCGGGGCGRSSRGGGGRHQGVVVEIEAGTVLGLDVNQGSPWPRTVDGSGHGGGIVEYGHQNAGIGNLQFVQGALHGYVGCSSGFQLRL